MEFTQLHHFQVVAQTENLSRAAQILYITQPALSKSISKLEKEIGCQLFDRSNSKLTLNRAGEIFLQYVDSSLALLEEGVQKTQGSCEGAIETVSIISSIPVLMGNIHSQYQVDNNIKISSKTMPSDDAVLALKRGTADFAIVTKNVNDPQLISEAVGCEKVFLVMNKKHYLSGSRYLALRDLKDETFISIGMDMIGKTEEYCANVGFQPIMGFISSDLFKLDGSFLKPNGEVAFVPAHRCNIALKNAAQDELAIAEIQDVECILPFVFVDREIHIKSAAELQVRELIRKVVKMYEDEATDVSLSLFGSL